MDVATWTRRGQVVVLQAVSVVVPVAFWRRGTEFFHLPKVTVLTLAATALLGLGGARALVERRRPFVWSSAALAGVAVAAAATLATVAADLPSQSFFGGRERYGGLVTYLACLVVLLTVLRVGDAVTCRRVAAALLVGGGVAVAYGLMQVLGRDPLSWRGASLPVFATMGNSNFFAGFAASIPPLALGIAVSSPRWKSAQVALVALAVLSALAVARSGSFQGVPATIAGTGLLLACWAWPRRGAPGQLLRRADPRVAAAVLVPALAVGVVASAGFGRFVLAGVRSGLSTRLEYWSAALKMSVRHPIIGSGLDSFGDSFFALRTASNARDSVFELADAPHSVPLGMFVGGGLVLGLTYLAFVVITANLLVRGLRRTDGAERLFIAGIGGAWLAYQVQAAVSIDVPSHALLHWLFAGMIGVLGSQSREGTAPRSQRTTRRRRVRRRAIRADIRVGLAAIAIIAAVGCWLVLRPIRADLAAGQGEKATKRDDGATAVLEARRATGLAGWRGRHWFVLAGAYEITGDIPAARSAAKRAFELEPGSSKFALLNAAFARKAGDVEDANRWYRVALRVDPLNPELLSNIAEFELSQRRPQVAIVLLRRAVSVRTDFAYIWVNLGRAEATAGHPSAARAAFERALDLEPQHPVALDYLRRGVKP